MNKYSKTVETDILQKILNLSGYKNTNKRANKLLEKYICISNILSKDNIAIKQDSLVNKKFIDIVELLNMYCAKKFYDNIKIDSVNTPNTTSVVDFLKREIGYEQNERFDILFLANTLEVISFENISKGTIDRSIIFMRNVLAQIISINAKYVILTHNHPSGSLIPSHNDIEITNKIKKGLALFEVILLDHIIVSRNGYYSFAEGGLI